MFKFSLWQSTAAIFFGAIALFTLPFRSTAPWMVGAFFGYLFLALIITVAMHRYFSHRAFKVSKPVHAALCLLSVLPVQGSTMGWVSMHRDHHKHADTNLDPHPGKGRWSTLIWKRYDAYAERFKFPKALLNDPWHRVAHRYYLAVLVSWVALMWAIDPRLVLDVYLPALGAVQLVTVIVLSLSHWGDKPTDWPLLEFVIPAGGEWSHAKHHAEPWAARHGKFDLGYQVIRLIAKRGSILT